VLLFVKRLLVLLPYLMTAATFFRPEVLMLFSPIPCFSLCVTDSSIFSPNGCKTNQRILVFRLYAIKIPRSVKQLKTQKATALADGTTLLDGTFSFRAWYEKFLITKFILNIMHISVAAGPSRM
jgi:hypothetical protein